MSAVDLSSFLHADLVKEDRADKYCRDRRDQENCSGPIENNRSCEAAEITHKNKSYKKSGETAEDASRGSDAATSGVKFAPAVFTAGLAVESGVSAIRIVLVLTSSSMSDLGRAR